MSRLDIRARGNLEKNPINANKIVKLVSFLIFIANIIMIYFIVYKANNPILIIYKTIFWGMIIINLVLLLASSVYLRKKIILINVAILVLIILFGQTMHPMLSEDEVWEYRNSIVRDIENNNIDIIDSKIYLPDDYIYDQISDTKIVILAMEGDNTVIYFYENAGLLEDSCGYIYYSNLLDANDCTDLIEFTNIKHITGNWFSCSTK